MVRLGHGDAMHVTDIDPDRPGLEIYTVPRGRHVRAVRPRACATPRTGEVLFGDYTGRDTGRGMVGDVLPDVPGLEAWASLPPAHRLGIGLYSATGELLGDRPPPAPTRASGGRPT